MKVKKGLMYQLGVVLVGIFLVLPVGAHEFVAQPTNYPDMYVEKNEQKGPLKIALVSISTPDRFFFTQYTLPSLQSYAKTKGYDFYIYDDSLDHARFIEWSKIKAVLNELERNFYDWVVWFDDDIYITNPLISLDNVIQENPQAEFIITDSINSGVFLTKNTSWAKIFLQQVWDIGYFRHNTTRPGLEERAIMELLSSAEYQNSPKIVQVPGRKIQSFLMLQSKDDSADHAQWQPGDFCAHLLGATRGARICLAAQLAQDVLHYPTLPFEMSNYTIHPPQHNAEAQQLSIAIATVSLAHQSMYTNYALQSLQFYANYWGYRFCAYEPVNLLPGNNYVQDLGYRIQVVLDVMKKNNCDWVMWCDHDVCISDLYMPLEKYLYTYAAQAHVIISSSSDTKDLSTTSYRLFFIKNTLWAQHFLQEMLLFIRMSQHENRLDLFDVFLEQNNFLSSPLINKVDECAGTFWPELKEERALRSVAYDKKLSEHDEALIVAACKKKYLNFLDEEAFF